jgi:NAD+ kinase
LEDDVRVLIVPNTSKREALEAGADLARWLGAQGTEAVMTAQDAAACGCPDIAVAHDAVAEVEMAVALGGDGTIIKAVHVLADATVPILGSNFGRLGFLTGAGSEDVIGAVRTALEGGARSETRMMLEAIVEQGGREVGRHRALNETFVGRVGASRVVDLVLRVGDTDLTTYTCDGLIVATPTGSTAYALSAGGPIVSPDVRGLVVVPVAPHTLAGRALVLGPDDEVEILCPSGRAADVCVTVDGQGSPCRMPLDRVLVRRSEPDVTLLRIDGHSFLDAVADKFLRT